VKKLPIGFRPPSTERDLRWFDRLFFPLPAHTIPYRRWWSIGLRTVHLIAIGILLGGHAFNAPAAQLRPLLYLAIATGCVMAGLESDPNLHFLVEGGGALMLLKLALLCAIPFAWDLRLYLLLGVVILASVGSHMSARHRHYSFLYGGDFHNKKLSA
jgi:hypothetical protein